MLDRPAVYSPLVRLPRWSTRGWCATGLLVLALISTWVVGRFLEIGPMTPDRWTDGVTQVSARRFNPSSAGPFERKGPRHCDLGGVTLISFAGGVYVHAPPALIGQPTSSYEADAELPADARPTGWHRGSRSLWVSPGERAARGYENIYIVRASRAERWPAWGVGCA